LTELERYFESFRRQTIGFDAAFDTPYGRKGLVYADWIASGRLYGPIEERMTELFGPMVGNTHSGASVTGTTMTDAYHEAREIIKRHVNAAPGDVLLACGSGMTAAVCKLQRLLGLAVPDRLRSYVTLPEAVRPVVFVTHMEHHSNQTTWEETLAEVVCLPPGDDGLVDPGTLRRAVARYPDRIKIGAFTACSNVTGIRTPYHELARIMHETGGLCFVDFAANAPYDDIDMHPSHPAEKLDAIYFSPHKFLGGPGATGILIFDSALYGNAVPDHPGGGTVSWTNPWGGHSFLSDIEAREDGGTPGFLQTIRAALAVKVKEAMSPDRMRDREHELLVRAFDGFRSIPGLVILADAHEERIGAVSFYVEGIHYNLIVKLLNDRYGVQVRGGCSCAGTYGHFLLHVDPTYSRSITDRIDEGDLSEKPGWVRLSVHPMMTDAELQHVIEGVREIVENVDTWRTDYTYDSKVNEFRHRTDNGQLVSDSWFDLQPAVVAVD